MTTVTREIQLTARPEAVPSPDHFTLTERELPSLEDGQILVRNTALSVDPYMRGRMRDVKSYVPPFELNAPLEGGAVGVVEHSRSERIPEGASVLHMAGWRSHAVITDRQARVVDTDLVPDSAYLGALGMPGLTAYVGLTRVAQVTEGDTVFVSGAAGAVGSMVGQLAKKLGAAHVIGSAGSPDKVSWLVDDLGFDAAFNYKDASVAKQLSGEVRELGTDGVDVYFDNVGGDHLEAALFAMSDFGRIAVCGAIADYNAAEPPPGPRNMMMIISKRLRIQGFIVSDHDDVAKEFASTVGPWLADGSITFAETIYEGLENAVDAFGALFTGENTGKMIVRLD